MFEHKYRTLCIEEWKDIIQKVISGRKLYGSALLLISTWLFLNPWQAHLINEEMVLKLISNGLGYLSNLRLEDIYISSIYTHIYPAM